MARLLPVPTLLLTVLYLAGCGTVEAIKDKQQHKELNNSLQGYETTLRWGHPEQAYGFLQPEVATQTQIPPGLDNIQVTGYQVIRGPRFVDGTTAAQTVSISYVLRDRQVQHSLVDNQVWKRADEESKAWYRANPIPRFE